MRKYLATDKDYPSEDICTLRELANLIEFTDQEFENVINMNIGDIYKLEEHITITRLDDSEQEALLCPNL